MTIRRLTTPTALVLSVFLQDPDEELHGNAIVQSTHLVPGTVYPILHRLTIAQWATVRKEERGERDTPRPLRRYYKLTAHGLEEARELLASRGWV